MLYKRLFIEKTVHHHWWTVFIKILY